MINHWGSYLLYNAIGTRKVATIKNYLDFPSKRGSLQSAILVMLSAAAAIITQTKPYEISAISIHSIVKLNFSHRGGSVVEYRTPEREVGGSRPTAAVLCP